MIKSLIDLDLYKLTMKQAIYLNDLRNNVSSLHILNKQVEYEFKCRNTDVKFSEACFQRIKNEVNKLNKLELTPEEFEFLENNTPLCRIFVNYLKIVRLKPIEQVKLSLKDGELSIVVFGSWIDTILYETMILAIVNQCHLEDKINQLGITIEELHKNQLKIFNKKIAMWKELDCEEFMIAEAGTRRRASFEWQDEMIGIMKREIKNFNMTSNVYLAMKHDLKPVGTVAHEWIMGHAGVTRLDKSNQLAADNWLKIYNGASNMLCSLTDTYTTDHYINTMPKQLLEKHIAFRQDSGCPKEWGNKMIDCFKNHEIDPKDKTFIFSDSLNLMKAFELYHQFKDDVGKISFIIGTYFTNDNHIVAPINIVMKLMKMDGMPLIKIGDDIGKAMCNDEAFKEYAINTFTK